MDGLEFASSYALQYRLTRYTEQSGCFDHRHITGWCIFDKEGAQFVSYANLPRCARGELFTCDNALSQPAVKRRRCNTKDRGGLCNRNQFALRRLSGRREARDVAMPAQIADIIRRKALACPGSTILTIEDARDDGIGIVSGQASNQGDGVFIGAVVRGIGSGQADLKLA